MLNRYNVNSTQYNSVNSYITMCLCHMVYPASFSSVMGLPSNNPAQIRSKERAYERAARQYFRQLGATQIAFIRSVPTGANCAIIATDSLAFVVFRGTEMASLPDLVFKADMLFNVMAGQVGGGVRYGGNACLVHSGLARAARSVAPRIVNTLANFGFSAASNLPVVVCGHSLGGAMSTLTGFDLKRQGLCIDAVYSHAGYMAGDKQFASAYQRNNLKHYLTINEDDPVPWIPQQIIDTAKLIETMGEEITDRQSPIQRILNTLDTIFTMPPRMRRAYCHVHGELAYLDARRQVNINPSYESIMSQRLPGLRVAHHATHRYALKLFNALSRNERRGIPRFRPIV